MNIQNFSNEEILSIIEDLKLLVEDGDIFNAIQQYENIIYEVDNHKQNMLITKAIVELLEDHGEQIVEIYVSISLYFKKHDPETAQDFMNLAFLQNKLTPTTNVKLYLTMLIGLELLDDAIDFMEAIDDKNVSEQRLYSDLLFDAGYYQKAIVAYTRLLEIDNKLYMHENYAQIGRSYMQIGDFDNAEIVFLDANIINDIDLLLEISQEYEKIGELRLALKHYLTILNLGEPEIEEKVIKLNKLIDENN